MKKYTKNIKAFTFVELIVVMIIVVILSGVWFSSYVWYISSARDSQRKSDLLQINSALKLYKQKRWYYGFPWDYFNITYNSNVVAIQWKLNKNIHIDSIDKLPTDPKTKWYYSYSITNNKQEFMLAWTLENSDFNTAFINWNYKSVSKNILPSILLAIWAAPWTNVEIQSWNWDWSTNRNLFIYDNQEYNLPYNFIEPFAPFTKWITFENLLTESESYDNFWQNTDFRNCIEIDEAWKLIIPLSATPIQYQIISNTWALIDTTCSL